MTKVTMKNSYTPEYRSWEAMKRRCNNPKSKNFKYWGGKGISVCQRWINSFENFYQDMGEKPTPKHTLDRIDPNIGYSPENCRWATYSEQKLNQLLKPGKSGFFGVYRRNTGKYQVGLRIANKTYAFGHYSEPEEAACIRDSIFSQVYKTKEWGED